MKDKIGIFFTDNSDREKGYSVNVNEIPAGKIKIDEANQTFIEEGKAKLMTDNEPKPSATGEDYQINVSDVGRGTHQIKLINFNDSGNTTASLGAIEVFQRAKLYLYIGDEEVLGTGNLSDLHLYEGDSVQTLEELMQDSFVKTHTIDQPSVSTDWTEAKAQEYAINNKFGAEVSYIDSMSANYNKPIAVWRLAVPNAIASTNYANNGNALQFIQDNISQHINLLRDKFVQARISGVVINMDNRDQNVISSYQGIIDWLRSYLDFEDLPIVLTDRRGVKSEIKDSAYFKVQDRGDAIGKWYAERELTGYYGKAYTDYGGIKWNKLYELDGTEFTGSHCIKYNCGEFDAYLKYYAEQNGVYDNWNAQSYYNPSNRYAGYWTRMHRPLNLLVGGRGAFTGQPQQFMYIESGKNIRKTFEEWMEVLKVSTYDEWEDAFAGTGINLDFLYTGKPHPSGSTPIGQYFTMQYKRPELFNDPVNHIYAKSLQYLDLASDIVEIIPYGRQVEVHG
jgi:hypothetical protein